MKGMDLKNQTDFILWSLKNDKSSRRIIASMFNPVTNSVKTSSRMRVPDQIYLLKKMSYI